MGSCRRRVTTLFAATALVLACAPAHAGAPTDRLREFFAKVNAILADPTTADRPLQRVALVRRLVNDVADVQSAAARALGAEWDRRSAAERDEFVVIFTELLERAYVGRLAGAAASSGSMVMAYGDELRTGDEAKVTTTLRGTGNDLRVEYVMTLRGGRWRVRDIVVDGVSTVENYRAQFSRVLQHETYSGLVRQLREKLARDGRMFAKWVSPATPAPIEQDIPFAMMTPADAPASAKGRKPAPQPARVATPPPPREPGPRPAPPEERVVRPALSQEHVVRPDPAPSGPMRVEPPPPRTLRPEPRPALPQHTVVRAERVDMAGARPAPRPVDVPSSKAAASDLPSSALAPVVAPPTLDSEPHVLQMLLGAVVLGVVGATIAALIRRRRDDGARPVPAQVLWAPDEHHRARDVRGVAGI